MKLSTKLINIFALFIVLIWLDELIDMQKILFGAEATPINWPEAVLETILIAALGYFTVTRLFPRENTAVRTTSLKGLRHIWIPVLLCFVGLFVIIWLNEIIDLPYLLLKREKTPVNWAEALVESFFILCIGLVTFTILFHNTVERSRAQELFSKSFYFSPIPVAITSVSQGMIVQANDAFSRITGYDRKDLIGKTVFDINIWEQPERREEIVRKLREKGSVQDVEVGIRNSDGEIRTCLYSAQVINLDEPHILSMAVDITDRKRSEELLKKAEAKYRNMFMHSINGVAVYNARQDGEDFVFADLNKSAERIDSITREEVVGKSVLDVFPGIRRFGLFDVFKRVYKTGISERFPISQYTDDRIEGWRENYVYKLSSGEVVAVYSDETARRKAENDLKERERALITLMGNLPGMAYRCRNDRDWTMEYISEGCYPLTGYKPSDIIGSETISYAQVIHPDDRNMVWQTVQSSLIDKKHFQMTYRIITADGNLKWVWEQGIGIFSEKGDLVALEGFISDITTQRKAQSELRRSEEKFSKAFHASPDWIVITTLKDGIFIDVNETFLKNSGYTLEEVIGRSSLELGIWEDDNDRAAMVEVIRKHGGVRNLEVRFRTKHGDSLTMLLSSEQFAFGGEECIISMIRDITERKTMEERLKHSEKQLRELYKHLQKTRETERTSISREIHDELGQELTGLKLDVAYLIKKMPRDKSDLINKAAAMSQHIDMSLESVRRISMDLRPALLDQLGLVAAIEWQTQDFEKRTGIACSLEIEPGMSIRNKDLSTTIFRVFQETLTNITRHAKATRVDVRMRKINGSISLDVKDNGIGIPKDEVINPRSFGLIGMRERVSDWGGDIRISGSK
ncbi:MAG TPA: PAS domain S-box protein, partial [Deltaproteobacteria bacterium]|nr:PAS domain S-box protein [Deltaproteobacteria bacterium]